MLKQLQNLNTQDVREKVLLNATVKKYFGPTEDCPSGWFKGHVTSVDPDLIDKHGKPSATLYLIVYSDGDTEHVDLEELSKIISNRKEVEKKLASVKPQTASTAVQNRQKRPAEPVAKPSKKRQLEPQPAASPAATSSLVVDADTPDVTGSQPLSQSAANRQQRITGNFQKDAPRAQKRKDNEEPEPAAENAPKRNARRSEAAPGASRLAPRPHAAHAAQPHREVAIASESNQPLPLNADGIRATGLPGHLKSIEAINFMCHEHMVMDFGPHVTFVSGQNGSGKSAVLQAAQCCLGVKASQTGRAPSMKHFVRTGCQEAIVRVTVYNKPYKGFDAFQHELYGDTITVERRIVAEGASSNYILKDCRGKVVARKRTDLDNMLSVLNIDAANPVACMTQDTARNFLAGSSAAADKQKYDMYMEATQLGTIAYNLSISKSQVIEMEEPAEKLRAERAELVADVNELKKKVISLKGVEEWMQEQQEYEQVLAWKLVEDQASIVETIRHKIDVVLPQSRAVGAARVEEKQNELIALQAAFEDKQQFLSNFNQRSKENSEEFARVRDEHKELRKEATALEKKVNKIQQAIDEQKDKKEALETALAETQCDTTALTAQYTKDLQDAQEKNQEAKQAAAQETAAAKTATERFDQAQAIASEARRAVQTAQGRVKSLQYDLSSSQKAVNDRVQTFGGAPMVALLKQIEREKSKFRQMPIGPIGLYLDLEDPRWSVAVESAIGRHMHTFLVGNRNDCDLLLKMVRGIFRGKNWVPNIVVSRMDLPMHNIPASRQPSQDVQTLYRILKCTEERYKAPIMNFLVDNAYIEKTAVTTTAQLARAIVNKPNCGTAFMSDGSKFMKRADTIIFEPERRNISGRLGRSGKDVVDDLRRDLAREQSNVAQLEQAAQQAQAHANSLNEEAKKYRIALAKLKKQEHATQQQVDLILSQMPPELDPTQRDVDDDDNGVQKEIFEATQACIDLQAQLAAKQTDLDNARIAVERCQNELERIKEEGKRLAEENSEFAANFAHDAEAKNEAEHALQAAKKALAEVEQAGATLENQLAKVEADLATLKSMAEACCSSEDADIARGMIVARLKAKGITDEEEIQDLMEQDVLTKKIEVLRKKIASVEREAGGSLEELEMQRAQAELALATRGASLAQAVGVYDTFVASVQQRIDKFKAVAAQVEDMVNKRFNLYMQKKGHLGKLTVDKKTKTLSLSVQVDQKGAKGANPVKDLKQLSGGERSYTTVAFALALGGETSMPFRAMDEFDVFMDAVNRRVAMTNLLVFAKEMPELQFIFLTPQDMAAVEEARQACINKEKVNIPKEFIKIVQMRAARPN